MEPNDLPPGAVSEASPDLPPGAVGEYSSYFGPPSSKPVVEPPPRPLTPLESLYRKARPYLSNAIELVGAIGGGVVGTAAGTVATPTLVANPVTGGAAGAGLGYGMARSLNRAADHYIGGYDNAPLSEQIAQVPMDIATGATVELGGQATSRVIGKTVGAAADIWNAPKLNAAKILRDAATNGKNVNSEELLWAIRTLGGREGQTTAQATASVNNPTWQALMQRAGGRDPAYLRAVEQAQTKQSLSEFGKLTPGDTATGARTAMDELKDALNQSTTPMREKALERANLGQLVSNLERESASLGVDASAQVAKVRKLVDLGETAEAHAQLDLINANLPTAASKYTYKGELGKMADKWADQAANASLDLGQGSRFAQAGADSLRAAGISPLETAPLISRIRSISNNPNYAGNDILDGAVSNIADDLAAWTNNNGVIDAKALDAIRKNSVNAAISKLRPGVDATTQKNLAAKVMGEIKPLIDNAIEASGGTGWRDYLNAYSGGMRDIAEKKLTGKALELWKTDRDAFVRLVQGESPKKVEKILGPGSYDIAKELSDHEMSILQSEAQKHLTNVSAQEQASEGMDALQQVMKRHSTSYRIPTLFNSKVTLANKALDLAESKISEKTMRMLTEASQDPKRAEYLLEFLPASERNTLLRYLSNPKDWVNGKPASTGVMTYLNRSDKP